VTGPAPALAPDLHAGLRRLKLSAMRTLAPELLITAKTQRWAPEELLRTLVEAEISARDASNARHRLKAAAFPVAKTLEEFDVAASSIPRATFDYLASLEWIGARENLCLVGPAGTGKSHMLIALGVAAVQAGHRVRYFTASELVEALYRGLADNSVGRVIDTLLRADLVIVDELAFAPLDDTAPSCWSGSSPPPTNAAPWASARTGHLTSGADSCPSTPPRSACSTVCCTTASSWSPRASRSACATPEAKEAPA
jgi:DNA replication protein DnaC